MDFFSSYIKFRKRFQKYIKHICFRKTAGNKYVEFVINGLLYANTLPSVSCDLVGKDCQKQRENTREERSRTEREKSEKHGAVAGVPWEAFSFWVVCLSHTTHYAAQCRT